MYQRFVDDLLILGTVDLQVVDICSVLNSWKQEINVSIDASENGSATNFLDVSFRIGPDGRLLHETHRKPSNTYGYTPWSSNHSRRTLCGIIHTEIIRIRRTSQTADGFNWQVKFFCHKLYRRGFPVDIVQGIVQKYRFDQTNTLQKPREERTIVPFRMNYCVDADSIGVSGVLKQHEHLLKAYLGRVRPLLCYTTYKNLFRERYGRFL